MPKIQVKPSFWRQNPHPQCPQKIVAKIRELIKFGGKF